MTDAGRPLRFCLATTFYPPYAFGGDAVAVERLAKALAGRGHAVRVVHDRGAYERLGGEVPADGFPAQPETVERVALGGSTLDRLDLVLSHQAGRPVLRSRRLAELLQGFDVVHFHNVSLLGGPGILRYGEGVKLCTLHDYWFVCPTHILWRMNREPCERRTCLRCTIASGRPPQLWRGTGAVSRAAAEVHAFLAGSEFARRRHVDAGLRGRIEVLPPFVPDQDIERGRLAAGTGGRPSGRPFFLVVSRLEEPKGVQDVIRTFATYRRADLLIAGRGAFEHRLRQMADGLGHVRFLGWRDHAALGDLYRRARAVVVPSRCYESFGLVAIEALAAATPVVVRDRGALPEVVGATGGGLVYRDPEALAPLLDRLLDDPALGAGLGERGRRAVERDYSESAHVERYLRLVGDLIARRAGAGL